MCLWNQKLRHANLLIPATLNNLILRSITGAILVAVIVGSIISSPWLFAGIILLISIASLIEFFRLVRTDKINPLTLSGLVLGVATVTLNACVSLGYCQISALLLLIPLCMLVLLVELFRNQAEPLVNSAYTWLAVGYIAMPLSLLNYFYVPSEQASFKYLLSFFVFIWINDTMAYLVGRQLGKHALFPRISPKKTWEGTVGGILFTLLAATGISYFTGDSLVLWLAYALVILVPAIYGDLIESMFKRSLAKKDSGSLLPGHGGFLDRFDAVFFAAPFAFIFVLLFFK